MRVLQACQTIPGHVYPNLGLALTLRDRGHEVAFYSGARAREKIEHQGFPFHSFQADMDRALTRIIFPPPGELTAGNIVDGKLGLSDRKRVEIILKQWFLDTIPHQLEDLQRIFDEFRPDVLVCDFTLMGPILVLQHTSNVPVAVFCVIPACPIPGPEVPHWGPGLARAQNPLQRISQWARRKGTDWVLSGYRAEANRLRTHYGLGPLAGRVADEYGKAPLFFVAGTPSLDYNRTDLPPCVHYVGLCEAENRVTSEAPDWLRAMERDKPIVHVTEGTVHFKDPLLLRSAVQGLRDQPLHVVISTGSDRRPEELGLGSPGANFRIEQFIPHEPLFEKCDVLVTTGSAGTVSKALVAGVPIVIVPLGWEHAENAQRIAESGVGVRLDPGNCNPDSLRSAVNAVLENPRYRERARAVGEEMLRQGGGRRAAELLEDLVACSPGAQTSNFRPPDLIP